MSFHFKYFWKTVELSLFKTKFCLGYPYPYNQTSCVFFFLFFPFFFFFFFPSFFFSFLFFILFISFLLFCWSHLHGHLRPRLRRYPMSGHQNPLIEATTPCKLSKSLFLSPLLLRPLPFPHPHHWSPADPLSADH